MTFYLKYRPQLLNELDLTEVRESLQKLLVSKTVPHAFLFSGPKGTGKTSAARIIAKVVNCERPRKSGEPCNKCDACTSIARGENIDVIELDAASHRGIDDVRALRNAVKLAPAKAKKKVYIVDEAHMLTTEASNALLKTLEEPPSHAVFILATTNPEKLIATIRSRATGVPFRNAKKDEIVRSLKRVVKGEKLKVSNDVLDVIVSAARGSLRDSHKILEQLVSESKLSSADKAKEFLYKGSSTFVEKLVGHIIERDVAAALGGVEEAIGRGISADLMVEEMMATLHASLLAKEGMGEDKYKELNKKEVVYLIRVLTENTNKLRNAVPEQIPLELAIVQWCDRNRNSTGGGRIQVSGKKGSENTPKSRANIGSMKNRQKGKQRNDVDEGNSTFEPKLENDGSVEELLSDGVWGRILSEIKPINTSMEALLRASKPLNYDGNTLTLGVFYRFHKERLEENHHRQILEKVIETVLGTRIRVICILTQPPVRVKSKSAESTEQVSKNAGVVLTEGEDEDIINVAKEIFSG